MCQSAADISKSLVHTSLDNSIMMSMYNNVTLCVWCCGTWFCSRDVDLKYLNDFTVIIQF